MGFKLGPILSFRGLGGESNVEWRVSALIVQDSGRWRTLARMAS